MNELNNKRKSKCFIEKCEDSIIDKAPPIFFIVGLIGLVGIIVCNICNIWFKNNWAEIWILFLTLFILTFYVKDTRRIAKTQTLQFRALWIAEIFRCLSTRIDSYIGDIKNKKLNEQDKHDRMETHKTETDRHLAVFFDLWPIEAEKESINNFRERLKKAAPKEIEDILTEIKDEMQKKVGKLISLTNV